METDHLILRETVLRTVTVPEQEANLKYLEGKANSQAAAAAASATAASAAQAASEAARDAASASQTNAAQSKSDAGASATQAVTARQAAEVARNTASAHADNASASAATATTQAGTATAQAGIATTQADTATTQAGNAAIQAGIATTQAGSASTSATAAQTARTAAESARDAALIQAGVYVDEPTGRAAVADGVAFKVQGSGDVAAFEYRRISAAASQLLSTYPSKSAVDKKAAAALGKNLVNPADADVAVGYFPVHTTGALSANASYTTTGFVPVTAGQQYTLSSKHYLCWYNASKVFISGTDSSVTAQTVTAPAGAAYLRASARNAGPDNWSVFQIEAGAVGTPFEAYGYYLQLSAVKDGGIPTGKLADNSVVPGKTSFLQLGKNLFNKDVAVTGSYVDPNNGNIVANATYGYSDYIPVTPGATYSGKGSPNSMRFVAYYDQAKIFVAGGSAVAVTSFTVPAGVYFVRVSFWAAEIAAFQFEAAAAPTSFEPYSVTLKFGTGTAPIYATVKDASLTTAKYAPGSVTPSVVNFLQASKNLFNKATVTVGQFMGNNGVLTPNASYNVSDYIPVSPGTQYYGYGAPNDMRMYCYFDANHNVVAGGSNSNATTFTPPAGAAFVRITVYAGSQDAFQLEVGAAATGYQAYGFVLKAADGTPINTESSSSSVSKWSGKAWATLGDSITAGNTWQPSVAAKLGLVHTNYGVGGTKLSGAAGDANAMCQDTRINAIPTTIDALTLMAGTNDWAQNVALGAVDSTDPLTFNGAFNTFATKAMARWPAKRIFVNTTPYGEIYDYVPRGWSNAYTNTLGLTTRDYAEALRTQARRWGFPCADVSGNAGWNTANIRTFVNDDGALLHPNATGGDRVATVVIGTFRSVEPTT